MTRVLIPNLDKSLTIEELKMLAKARGGHRLVVCGDRDCCLHGLEDMITNWRPHFLYQRFSRIRALEKVPNHNRTRHFLNIDMAQADRLARQVKELKTGDEKMIGRLTEHSRLVEARRAVLENLQETRGDSAPRAPAAISRGVGAGDDRQGRV